MQKIVAELHGIIHGIPGAADKEKEQARVHEEQEGEGEASDFQESMDKWRSAKAQEEADARKSFRFIL